MSKKIPKAATCHPDRWIAAKGLCAACYRRWLRSQGRLKPAPCHPEKPHYAKGLCSWCYKKSMMAAWPSEKREAKRHRSNEYRNRWREEIKVRAREWYHTSQKSPKFDPLKARKMVISTRYGLKPEDVAAAIERQSGKCAICRETPSELVVDHCHKTDRFRSMLCRHCNLVIGYARENPQILAASIAYLALHSTGIKWAS